MDPKPEQKNALRKFEDALGLPSLRDIANLGEKIPDKETLSMVMDLLKAAPDKETIVALTKFMASAEKLMANSPDLVKIIDLLKVVKELDFNEINHAIGQLNDLLKKVPKEGMDALVEMAKGLKE
jgi:hypothetical protein